MSSHREKALGAGLTPLAAAEPPANERSSAADPTENAPAQKPALVLLQGGARLTSEQQALVAGAMRLVNWAIKQRVPGTSQERRALRAELRAYVLDKVAKTAKAFDPSKGEFSTYVMPCIRGAIRDFFDEEKEQSAVLRAGLLAGRQFVAERSHRVNWAELNAGSADESEQQLVEMVSRFVGSAVVAMAYEHPDPEQEMAELLDHKKAVEVTRAALPRMTKAQRSVHTLKFLKQQEVRVIAEELGVDERSVTRYAEQVLDILMEALVEAGVAELPRPRG